MRGEVFRLHAPRGSRDHEQPGSRYAVVGKRVGFLSLNEMRRVDAALRVVLDL